MKNKFKFIITTVVTANCLLTSIAQANKYQIYSGADLLYSKMNLEEKHGGNLLSRKFTPGVNLFAGYMFNNNFGAEIGYEIYKSKKNITNVTTGDYVFGNIISPGVITWFSFNSRIKQQNLYLGGVAKLSVSDNIDLNLMLGGALSQIRIKSNKFNTNLGATDETRNFSKNKLIPMIRASLEHKLNNDFNIRVLASWKNTSRFKIRSKENPSLEARLKDSFGVGLGLVYHI